MTQLRISARDFEAISERLVGLEYEQCAVAYLAEACAGAKPFYLLREVLFPKVEDYTEVSDSRVELRSELVAIVSKRSARERSSLVFIHSHVASNPPRFSAVDDFGEERLARFLRARQPGVIHFSMVISPGGVRARILGSDQEIAVVTLGTDRRVRFWPDEPTVSDEEVFDRQVLAFGRTGQSVLSKLRVGIVGLGGTGSIIAEQLGHLGVGQFVLVDPWA